MIQPKDGQSPGLRSTPVSQDETQAHTPASSNTGVTTDVSHMTSYEALAIEKKPDMPVQIGDYQLIEQLGKGGMGVVYLARHQHLHQLFAIKMLRDQDYSGSQSQRFLHEAQVVADLKHPGIVQVHHFAVHESQPYLVMEYLPEGSLDKKLKTSLYSPRDAAALVAALADAMHAAHEKKIIHRDLKPHNVLLTEQGLPKITDFGLARRTDHELTREFSYIGTPPYMSPEQARGQLTLVNERSDIYALGAILYEMLTGRPPFRGSNDIETMRLVCDSDVVPVRTLQPKVPIELETICLHCLQKDQSHRYASASALKNDLQAFLDNRSISVRPIGSMTKAWRWCKRNPTIASLSGSIAALLIAGITVALWLAYWAFDERQRANKALNDNEITLSKLKSSEEELEHKRKDLVTLASNLIDLSSVGRFLCTDRLRSDFSIRLEIIPCPTIAEKSDLSLPPDEAPLLRSPYFSCSPVFMNAMWQDVTPVVPGTPSSGQSTGLSSSIAEALNTSPRSSSTGSLAGSGASAERVAAAASPGGTGVMGGHEAQRATMNFLKFSQNKRYSLEVKTDTDCYLTVLLVQPSTRQCRVVYPNEFSPSVLIEKNKTHTLLHDARAAMQPNVSTSPEFIYVLATTKPWTPEMRPTTTAMLASATNAIPLNLFIQPIPNTNTAYPLLAKQIEALVIHSEILATNQPALNNSADATTSRVAVSAPTRTKLTEDVYLFYAFPPKVTAPIPEPKKADTKPPA